MNLGQISEFMRISPNVCSDKSQKAMLWHYWTKGHQKPLQPRWSQYSTSLLILNHLNYLRILTCPLCWESFFVCKTETTIHKRCYQLLHFNVKQNTKTQKWLLSGLLFQSIVQNLGGWLKSSLSPLNRDPGVSLGQMISEFLKQRRHFSLNYDTMHLLKVLKCMYYLVRRLGKHSFLPEIRCQIAVSLRDRIEGGLGCNENTTVFKIEILKQGLLYPEQYSTVLKSLTKVAQSGSAAPGRGVAVIDTSHHQQFLGHRSRHNAGTTGSGNETHQDWTTATGHLNKYIFSQ